jgi:cell fate regulator YaaT (PSP1 superfamily)
MNTFDWLSNLDIQDTGDYDLVEVTFKNGARKDFYHNPPHTHTMTGDTVLVEVPGGGGYDVGIISLSGDLVRMQLKKKRISSVQVFQNVIRKANERDVEKLHEARAAERGTMIRARAAARTLDLDMKIGDVEYQGDGRKATFFYIADGRVDFRELIRIYAKDFKVKIEMRQIGARQESSRVGGIGSCGRELCCTTWLSDFRSVSTVAARYQNLAINQSKLSGACGRLKCCLNYELDTYLDALEHFPEHADRIKTQSGIAVLIKTDVFKGLMTYVMDSGTEKGKFYTLAIAEVFEVQKMNKRGEMPEGLKALAVQVAVVKNTDDGEPEVEYEDVIGAVELRDDRKNRGNSRSGGKGKPSDNRDRDNRGGDRGGRDNRGGGNRENAPQGDRADRPQNRPNNPPKAVFTQGPKGEDANRDSRPPNPNRDRPPNPNRDNRDNRPPNPNRGENGSSKFKDGGGENRPNRDNRGPNSPQNPNRENRGPNPNRENRPPRPPNPNGENSRTTDNTSGANNNSGDEKKD